MNIADLDPESFLIYKSGIFLKNQELIIVSGIHLYKVAPFMLRSMIKIKRHSRNRKIKRLINRSLPKDRSFFHGFVIIKNHCDPAMYFETENKDLSFTEYAKLAYIKVVKEKEYLRSLIHKIEMNLYGKENF
ncbi:TPA: hypothetical protein ACGZ99_003460 [Elizabethkingia anophelis]